MLKKLGKYEIEAELGSGAMGVVYKARDPRLGRAVALKTMTLNVANNPDLKKRFYREAQAAGQLKHPNIVTIYDIDEADGLLFIAMEFLEGEDLEKIISSARNLPLAGKLEIVAQICRGLHYAHQRGIVHRDIKPGNIVVLDDGQVKIVDFGIARIGDAGMTNTGMILGTVTYMSPEQIRAQTVDARSDIFSVGVVLYELLTSQVPFAGPDVPAIVMKILNEAPEPLANYVPNCPPEVETAVLHALEKDREKRYRTAEDLAFDLQRVATGIEREMVEVYLKQAQRSLEAQDLTLAKESLQKVLEADSGHALARSLLEQVQAQMQDRQRAGKIEQLLSEAKEAMGAESYDQAVFPLEEVLALDPEHREAQQYRKMALERHARKKKLGLHMERAERMAAEANFQAAKTELEAVLALDRNHAAAHHMMDWVTKELTEQERLRHVRQHIQSARSHLAEKNFAQALELLDKARELDPVNLEVESLRRQVEAGREKEERRQALQQHLSRIQETLQREDSDRALDLTGKALQEFPDEPQVVKLHTQATNLAETRKKRSYVEEQLQAALGLLQKKEFTSALAVLERALETMPDDPRLASFMKTVEEARDVANRESLRREAIHRAKELILAKDFPGAIEALEKSLAAGQSPELAELLEFVRVQQREEQQQERLRLILGRAQASLREVDYEEAVGILERAQREVKAAEIDDLLATARRQLEELAERRQKLLSEALGLLQAGEPGKAVALLDVAPKVHFKDKEFQRVYTQSRESLARANFIRSVLEQFDKCIAQEDWVQARAVLHQALETYPDDPVLRDSQKRLREEQRRRRQPQLRSYEIVAPLGAGGAGEVYRARDTRLGREVAIKALKADFARDPERLARLEREVQILASLNHPNIAAVYGLEESGETLHLIIELVSGETLAERLAAGSLPLPEALNICRQIAEALEAAHEKAIVHRNLKPANVKITPEGKVKVLDFGLARAWEVAAPAANQDMASGIGTTRAGALLGTAAYMSPEQARGRPLDKRTDIWSFGCVFYEALTGRQLFGGETISDAIAATLTREADWQWLPQNLPPRIGVLLRRCLQKEASQRLRDVGDARIEIQEVLADLKASSAGPAARPAAAASRPAHRGWAATATSAPSATAAELSWTGAEAVPEPAPPERSPLWMIGAVIIALLAGLAWWEWRAAKPGRSPVSAQLVSAERISAVPFSAHSEEVSAVAFSPDGSRLASGSADKTVDLWELATGRGLRTLAGHAGKVYAVVFSRDGRWVASASEDQTVRLWEPDKGAVRILKGHTGVVSAVAFSPDGRLLATGGEDQKVKLWEVVSGREVSAWKGHRDWIRAVAFSPDGRWLASAGDDETARIWDPNTGSEQHHLAHDRGVSSLAFSSDGRWLATGSWQAARLWEAATGKLKRTLSGHSTWVTSVAFSPDGRWLASGSGDLTVKLWELSTGSELRTLAGQTRGISSVAFSPDGRALASGSWDKTVNLWNPATGTLLRTLPGAK